MGGRKVKPVRGSVISIRVTRRSRYGNNLRPTPVATSGSVTTRKILNQTLDNDTRKVSSKTNKDGEIQTTVKSSKTASSIGAKQMEPRRTRSQGRMSVTLTTKRNKSTTELSTSKLLPRVASTRGSKSKSKANGLGPVSKRGKLMDSKLTKSVAAKTTKRIVKPKRTAATVAASRKKAIAIARKTAAASPKTAVQVVAGKKRKKQGDDETSSSPTKVKKKLKKGDLIPNSNVTEYLKDPTFEQALPIPFISPSFQSKLLIRAVLLNDMKMLQKLTLDKKSIYSYNVPRCIQVNRHALSYAIEQGNVPAMKILLPNPEPKLANAGSWLIEDETTGRGSRYQFGHAMRNVTVGRGGKEGNAALLKDRFTLEVIPSFNMFDSGHWTEALEYGLPMATLEKMKGLFKNYADNFTCDILGRIVYCIRKGHHFLGAELIQLALTKGGFGFNNLHLESLTKSKKSPLSPFKFQSVGKKTVGNESITPLHCAAINPDPYCLATLLNMAPLYTITDSNAWTIAHYAAACTGTGPLELIISRGISTNQINKQGETPAHIAAEIGRSKNLELILQAESKKDATGEGADEEDEEEEAPRRNKKNKKIPTDAFSILRLNKRGFTPLQLACASGHLDCVKVLLDSPLIDKDKPTPAQFDRLTPLMIAAGYGHLDIVKHLISVGAKLKIKDRRGKIALAHAVINGHAHIVSYLLRLGDNHLAKDSSGNTLVHFACGYGWSFNLKLLLEAGCCPNEPNLWKLTPLAIAFCKGHIGIVEMLLKEPGVNIDAPIDDKGLTLLLQTVSSKPSEDMIQRLKYLIEEQKADCTVADFEKNTIIHYLVKSEHKMLERIKHLKDRGWGWEEEEPKEDYTFQAMQLIVKNGGTLEAKNSAGDSPISRAASYGRFQLVRKLIQLGAVLSPDSNASGDTLLHLLIPHLIDDHTCTDVEGFYRDCAKDTKSLATLKVMAKTYNNSGMTPLLLTLTHYPAITSPEKGMKVIEFILFLVVTLESDVNATMKQVDGKEFIGNSVLHLAAGLNYSDDVFKIILSKKPNLDPINSQGRTPLTISILKQVETATKILLESGADVNYISPKDEEMSMLLLEVSRPKANFNLVPFFISKGAVVSGIVDQETKNSILHFVSKKPTIPGAVEAIKALTRAGLPVDAENKYYRTSLHLAVTSRGGETDLCYDVEDALIEAGANLSQRDLNGRIPLHFAFIKIGKAKKATATTFMDPIELVTLLTSAMKDSDSERWIDDIEAVDEIGQTPLHAAAIRGATISASHLLALSPNRQEILNRQDKNGNTPLALSVLSGHEGCSLMLLQAGSDFVVDLNAGISKTLEEVASSWIWKPVKYEAERLDEENFRNAKYSILQEIVRKDWQGLLYLMLENLKVTGTGVTPGIEAAFKTKRFKLAAKLIDRVKSVDQLITKKQSLLHTFAQNASSASADAEIQIRILETLVRRKNADINALDTLKSTPVIYAAINWNAHLCSQFTAMMNLRQIPNLRPDFAGRTPFNALFWNPIVCSDFPADVKAWAESLLFAGGDGNVLCKYPIRTPTCPGVRYISQEAIDPNCFMSSITTQYSPLIMAVIYGNKKVVKWLLSFQGKIDINFPDSGGRTPLMHAVRLNDIQMVKLLLNPNSYDFEKDTNPWEEDIKKDGRQPKAGNKVTSDVDLNAVDKEGWTAIHHLVSPVCASTSLIYARAETILKLLGRAGANLNMKNQSRLYETPLEMALRHQKFAIAEAIAKILRYPQAGILGMKTKNGTDCEVVPEFEDDIVTIPISNSERDAKEMIDRLKEKLEKDEDEDLVEADSLSNFTSENSIILIDDSRKVPYDCLLTQVDLNYGVFGLYNFYKMQLIKQTKGPELIILFTRWGRMGDTGQYQKTPFPTEAEAVAEFKKIFRSKSGNSWDDLATTPFTTMPKKYKLVNLERGTLSKVHPKFSEVVKVDFDEMDIKSKSVRTQLSQNIFQLMKKLCFEHRSKPFDTSREVGQFLPFGQIDYATLLRAEGILDQIDKLLTEETLSRHKPTPAATPMATLGESLLKLSEEYFTLVPLHGYAFEKIAPFNQFPELRKHQQLIRNFLHNEFAFQLLLAAQWNQDIKNPLDYVYASLGTKLEMLDESSEEAQLILEYVYNTTASHNRPIIDKIYRVQILGADERLTKLGIGNRHLLWHGTQTCNLLSILHRGLQIAPLGYNFNGSLFGKGIYFADMLEKSIKYSSTIESGQPKFALLCEVALGQIQDAETGYWVSQHEETLKKGNHSLKTSNSRYMPEPSADVFWKGRRIPVGQQSNNTLRDRESGHGFGLDYNEYIVFKPEQANIKYLVQFRGKFPDVKLNNIFR